MLNVLDFKPTTSKWLKVWQNCGPKNLFLGNIRLMQIFKEI